MRAFELCSIASGIPWVPVMWQPNPFFKGILQYTNMIISLKICYPYASNAEKRWQAIL